MEKVLTTSEEVTKLENDPKYICTGIVKEGDKRFATFELKVKEETKPVKEIKKNEK